MRMGYIRFLLALSIIFGHIPISNRLLLGAPFALHVFFMISGYSIAYVLSTKYKTASGTDWKSYIRARLVRIYPLYFIVVTATLVFSFLRMLHGNTGTVISSLLVISKNIPLLMASVIVNITIFFQDLFFYFGFHKYSQVFFFTPNFSQSIGRIDQLLILPQSWALALELYFYCLAPLLIRKSVRTIVILIILSLMLRIYFVFQGYPFDPWSYRFFPTELFFFLSGMLSYKLRRVLTEIIPASAGKALLIFICCIMIIFRSLPSPLLWSFQMSEWIFTVIFLLFLPVLFPLYAKNPLQKLFSALSYPMYLTHMPVFQTISLFNMPILLQGVITIVCTIICSYALTWGIMRNK